MGLSHLEQVKLCRQEVLAAAGTDEVHRIFQSDSSASRTALSGSTSWRDYKNRSRAAGKRSYHKINTYLRRRDAFGLLDADMIVRGKVCDKSPGDLTVLLVEVVSDTIPSARAAVPQIDYDRYILTPKGSRSSSVYSEPREARSRTGYFGDAGHDEMDAAYYQSVIPPLLLSHSHRSSKINTTLLLCCHVQVSEREGRQKSQLW